MLKTVFAVFVAEFLLTSAAAPAQKSAPTADTLQTEKPLAVVLLVDKSSTAPRYITQLRQALAPVMSTLGPGDRIMLCEFQETTQCLTGFSANSNEILKAVETIKGKASSSANFADALDLAMDHLESAASEQKRAILLVSNAGERFQSSRHSQAQLVHRAQKLGLQIHMIEIATHFGSDTYHVSDSAAARRETLTSQTGGAVHAFGIPPHEPGTQLTDEELLDMEKLLNRELSSLATILSEIRRKPSPKPGEEDVPEEATAEEIEPPVPVRVSSAVLTAEMWKIIGWLPSDTEILMVARGPFTSPDFYGQRDLLNDDDVELRDQVSAKEIATAFELESVLAMAYLPEALIKRLRSQNVALAVRGLRHPHDSPTGEGLLQSEGCLILVFENNELDPDLLSAPTESDSEITQQVIAGHSVLVIQDNEERVYIVHPRGNTLIIATDHNYLEQLLIRIGERSSRRALPSSLPEWTHVDTNARFWALRHYDHIRADEDPTSPFNKNAEETGQDPQAIGITFSLDPGKPGLITYFTGDKNVLARFKSPYDEIEPEFKAAGSSYQEVEPGVLQISFPLTDANSISALSYRLGWLIAQLISGT